MNFHTLAINSILIAPEALHTSIRQSIIAQTNGVIGLRIQSLTQFLSSYMQEDLPSKQCSLFAMLHTLQTASLHLQTYQNIAYSESFLEECYRFLNDIQFWGIALQELPRHTAAQQELFEILSTFHDISTPGLAKHQVLSKLKQQQFPQVYIVDTFYTYDEKRILNILLERGAHLLTQPHQLLDRHFFHAVNKRQEIEACAQYIIEQKQAAQDIHITLCDTSYAPVLQQIFTRYEIPHTMMERSCTSLLAQQCIALFQFVLSPDSVHVMNCLDTGLFQNEDTYALREYMRIFDHDFFQPFQHVQTIHEVGNLLHERELEKLKKLEEKAAVQQQHLQALLAPLQGFPSFDRSISIVLSILKQSDAARKEATTYCKILHMLEDVYPYIQNREDLVFMLSFLEDIHSDLHSRTYGGVFVHPLTQPSLARPYHYMLGATQSQYPAFQVKKGIFDEEYYALLTAYPSMEDRYSYHQEQLMMQMEFSQHLYVSYPLGTYEGKGLECALEIEQYMGCPSTAYPLHTNYVAYEANDVITPQTAKRLFLRDGKLHGSISSLERYMKCPYAYFLRYGLCLQEPMKLGFPDAYAGTLSHFVLETLTTRYGKEYATATQETIAAIIDNELVHLQRLFPAMKDPLINVKERLVSSMAQTIKTLQEFEAHSSLTPTHCEYPFTYEIPFEDNYVLAMHGFIDRVDENSEFACILDYKSSAKTLSEANVFAALQLQLLTYAIVIAKESGKDVLGAYYVSLKNENIPCNAGKMSRRKPVTHHINDKEDFALERKKAQRFHGWTMHRDVYVLDDDATHIGSLRMNKEGVIKAGKLYDLNVLTTYMETMYKTIAKRILQGEIALKPLEDACSYCAYHEICRFKGYYEEKTQMMEAGEEIYQKGEENDA